MLAEARAKFESLVPVTTDRYTHTFSMFHENRSSPLYPVGESARRYMFAHHSYTSGALIAESMRGNKVTIDWSLPLIPRNPVSKPEGTLSSILASLGFSVDSRHLTQAQAASLHAHKAFVWYSTHPIMGWSVEFIAADGSTKSQDRYEPGSDFSKYLPICDDEAQAAGLGDKGWDAGGKLNPTGTT